MQSSQLLNLVYRTVHVLLVVRVAYRMSDAVTESLCFQPAAAAWPKRWGDYSQPHSFALLIELIVDRLCAIACSKRTLGTKGVLPTSEDRSLKVYSR